MEITTTGTPQVVLILMAPRSVLVEGAREMCSVATGGRPPSRGFVAPPTKLNLVTLYLHWNFVLKVGAFL